MNQHSNYPQRETSRALEAFGAYCRLGPNRSLAKLAEAMGKKPGYAGHLERWSAAFGWVERAKEWDRKQQADLDRQFAAKMRAEAETSWKHLLALRNMAGVCLAKVEPDLSDLKSVAYAMRAAIDGMATLSTKFAMNEADVDKATEDADIQGDIAAILPSDPAERRKALKVLAGLEQ